MSQENVEIVRRVFDAVAERDAARVLALYDPAVEVHFSQGTFADRIGEAGAYHGHAGLRAFDRELREAFEDFETNCEELIDGGDRVVSVSAWSQQRCRGRGAPSIRDLDGRGGGQSHARGLVRYARGSPRSRRSFGVAKCS